MNQEQDANAGHEADRPDDHHRHDITVKVFVPSQVEGRSFTWARGMKVADAAAAAAEAFGIKSGTPTLQNEDGVALDRQKTLAEAEVDNGDKLELVDVGGGV